MRNKLFPLVLLLAIAVTTASCNKDVEHSVTFNYHDSVTPNLVVPVKNGETVGEPTSPNRDNYIFDGWFLEGSEYNFDLPVTQNLTIDATWKEIPNWDDATIAVFNEHMHGEIPPFIDLGVTYETEINILSGGAEVTIFSTQPVNITIQAYLDIFEDLGWEYYAHLDSQYGVSAASLFRPSLAVPNHALLTEVVFGVIYENQAPGTNFIRIISMLIDLDFPTAELSVLLSMLTGNPEPTPLPSLSYNDYSMSAVIPNTASGYVRAMLFDFEPSALIKYQKDLVDLGYVLIPEVSSSIQYRFRSQGLWGELVLQITTERNITHLGFYPSYTIFWPKEVIEYYFENINIPVPFENTNRRFYFSDYIEVAGLLDIVVTSATTTDIITVKDLFLDADWEETAESTSSIPVLTDPTEMAQLSISLDASSNELHLELLQLFFTGLTWEEVVDLVEEDSGFDLSDLPLAEDSTIFAYSFTSIEESYTGTSKIDLVGGTTGYATTYKALLVEANFHFVGREAGGSWDSYLSPDRTYRINVQILSGKVTLEFTEVNTWLSELALIMHEFAGVDFSDLPAPTKIFNEYAYRPGGEFSYAAIRLIGAVEQDVTDYVELLLEADFYADDILELGSIWYTAPNNEYSVKLTFGGFVNKQIYLEFLV